VTSSSDFGRPTNLSQGVEALRAKWGWIVALGIIYLLVGLLALYSVVTATIASVFVVGIMMLIAGVAEVVNAFQVKSWGKFFLWVILGVLYIVAGFVTFENPLLAANSLPGGKVPCQEGKCREYLAVVSILLCVGSANWLKLRWIIFKFLFKRAGNF
jgi:uncharacterized membrane protein HdeD (DUF308 family)